MAADPGRYVEVIVQRGARVSTIFSCQECGAVVLHRAVHDAWHGALDELLNEFLGDTDRAVRWAPPAERAGSLTDMVDRIAAKARAKGGR